MDVRRGTATDVARRKRGTNRGAKGRERGGHGALAGFAGVPGFLGRRGGAVAARWDIIGHRPGRGRGCARGCGLARGGRGLGSWCLVREGVGPRRTDGIRLRGHGLVESCERIDLQEFVKVGQRCQVRQRSEARQWRQIWQGIELGQDEGVDPARGLLAACARRTRLRLAGRRHARIVVTHETFLPCGTGRWDARESIPSRCRRQEEAGTKALTPALDTAMSMSS